ncbi:MAG: hypothetical protein IJY48_07420, partial [Mailhella sp.]|nr:hypothetical protein [Mailhella sp.]
WNNEWAATIASITPEEVSTALRELLAAPSAEWIIRTTGTAKASAQPDKPRKPSARGAVK